ncbi:MAG: hypothetical protein KBT36_03480 [Kurthia sp.]|nr:hypothetical protein [Candidatus Kurthia equi]
MEIILLLAMFKKKKQAEPRANTTKIKHGFFHQNGNLDFYLTTDGSFISRTDNREFALNDVQKIEAYASDKLVFEKTASETLLHENEIERLFSHPVQYITYQVHFHSGDTFESVVDVATNKRKKQKMELKNSLYKLVSLLKEAELN